MIVKESQLQKDWPVELTPELREQFLKEKADRLFEWYQQLNKHDRQVLDLERS